MIVSSLETSGELTMDIFWLYAGFALVLFAILAGVALIVLAARKWRQD